jgi:3-dehydroquinate synthase
MNLVETNQGFELVYSLPGRPGAIRAFYANQFPVGWSKYLTEYHSPVAWIDENVGQEGVEAVKSVMSAARELRTIRVKPEKSLDMSASIWETMLGIGSDLAIAVGGGTLCDVVGWAASAFRRGTDHLFIPTTLLAMIDAAIGGKTGIDAYDSKNIIGAIHPAKWTFASLSFLATLPPEEISAALAEAIKIAILYDSALLDDLSRLHLQADLAEQLDLRTISRIAALKASVVEEEGRQRDGLLYGHNVGHAIESLPEANIRHGEAVAIGMSLEGWLAVRSGILDIAIWKLQQEMLRRLRLPRSLPRHLQIGDLVNAMRRYRLYRNGEFLFVVPSACGERYRGADDGYLGITDRDIFHQMSLALSEINSYD